MSGYLFPLLGLLASVLGMCGSFPQIVRLVRTKSVEGLSLGTAILGLVASLSWLAYGVFVHDPAQILANTVGTTTGSILLLLLARHGASGLLTVSSRAALAVLATAGALGLCAVLFGVAATGWIATVLGLVRLAPQARIASRGLDLRGLSPASCLLGTVAASLWTVYGLGTGQLPVLVSASCCTVPSLFILLRRCPPQQVARSLERGRLGAPGRALVAPVMAFAR